jgi:hypothetical protein
MFHIRVMSPRRPIPTVAPWAEAAARLVLHASHTFGFPGTARVRAEDERARKEEPMRRPVATTGRVNPMVAGLSIRRS